MGLVRPDLTPSKLIKTCSLAPHRHYRQLRCLLITDEEESSTWPFLHIIVPYTSHPHRIHHSFTHRRSRRLPPTALEQVFDLVAPGDLQLDVHVDVREIPRLRLAAMLRSEARLPLLKFSF